MKRFKITVPLELTLSAENEADARVELLKIRSEISKVYYTHNGAIITRVKEEHAKVEELPF